MSDFAERRRAMVDTQVRPSDVTKFPIIQAMLSVPREAFVPTGRREAAYLGDNLELTAGRVMLEPRTLAKLLDALDVEDDDLVLDIGSGLGYSAAVLARLAEAVIAVEEDEAMAIDAEATLAAQDADNVAVIQSALTEGAAKHGPYDVITIQGAVEHIPAALIEQLKDGGRIAAIFMDGNLGVCRIGYKLDGEVTWRFLFNAGAPVLPGFTKETGFLL